MPQALSPTSKVVLLDTSGRKNRHLEDRACQHCGRSFRPLRASSRYCSRPCAWANNGKHQQRLPEVWWTNGKGYVEGRIVENGKVRRVKKHRFVMEKYLGRRLEAWEDVHHKDGNKTNNAISNLEVISHGEHTRHHFKGRIGNTKGQKLNLTVDERRARSERMRERHASRRAALSLVDGHQNQETK